MTLDFSLSLDIQKKRKFRSKSRKIMIFVSRKIQNSGSKKGMVGRCRKKETGCRKKWFTTVQSGVGEKAPFRGQPSSATGCRKKGPPWGLPSLATRCRKQRKPKFHQLQIHSQTKFRSPNPSRAKYGGYDTKSIQNGGVISHLGSKMSYIHIVWTEELWFSLVGTKPGVGKKAPFGGQPSLATSCRKKGGGQSNLANKWSSSSHS